MSASKPTAARGRKQPSPELGELITAALEGRGMTKSELADAVNLSPAYIRKLAAGKDTPPAEPAMQRIATALGLEADELMFAARMIPADIEEGILQVPPEVVREFLAINGVEIRETMG